ncbi:MAG: helix-turn-helix transcriptional regulator [Armatimonadetes bacterium]|nr:helix-turn-helix transcriptional regulator [Armatimonadota bacterium]
MQVVVESRFHELRRRKALAEGRDISLRTVARETELALATIQRVASTDTSKVAGVRLSTLDALCRYFNVSSISELVEFKPN